MSESMGETAVNLSNDGSLDWMRQIQVQQRRCDEENGVLRNLFKRAKAAGENIKSMKSAIRATKLDPTEVVNDLRHQVRYMALRNIPVTPEELLRGWDNEVSQHTQREDDLWDAAERGYKDGRAGLKIEDAPYPPGSELFVAWQTDWIKGQTAIARELGPDAQQADPSRKRPTRARRAKAEEETGEEAGEAVQDGDEGVETVAETAPATKPKRVAGPGKRLGRPKGSTNGVRRPRRQPTKQADGVTTY